MITNRFKILALSVVSFTIAIQIFTLAEAETTAEKIQSGENTVVAKTEKFWLIDKDAAVRIPVGWKITLGLTPPIQMVGENGRKDIGFSVLKELPADVEVSTLEEYAALKVEVMKESFPDFAPSEPKAGKIGELPASFFQGPGTVESVKGELVCMAVQGKESFYLLMGVLTKGSSGAGKTELMKVIRSFQEKG